MASELTIPASVPGRFGPYGGRYVPETLMVPLLELERAYEQAQSDPVFQARFADLLKNFAGRPTPMQFAKGLGLLAVQMKKPRVVAETGAGQHGVATATVAAYLGLQCTVYMGTEDMARQ